MECRRTLGRLPSSPTFSPAPPPAEVALPAAARARARNSVGCACMYARNHSLTPANVFSCARVTCVCVCVCVRAAQMLKEEIRATRTQLDVNPNDSMALAKIGELRLELAMLKQVSLLQYYNMILS